MIHHRRNFHQVTGFGQRIAVYPAAVEYDVAIRGINEGIVPLVVDGPCDLQSNESEVVPGSYDICGRIEYDLGHHIGSTARKWRAARQGRNSRKARVDSCMF